MSLFVNYITNTRRCFEELMNTYQSDQEDFLKEIKRVMRSVKCRLIVFVVIACLFICFFWYYVSAFCAVYKNTQTPLMIGCLISILFLIAFQMFVSFIIMLMRYIGLRCRCQCLYKASVCLYWTSWRIEWMCKYNYDYYDDRK